MKISLIAAIANRRVIGKNNQLPWHLPADLKYFKATTLNKPIVMGRKTYESLGKPLPQRTNIILTSDRTYKAHGCYVVHSFDEAIQAVKDAEEIFIIGGATLFQLYLPLANRFYLTMIHADFEGDTFFPDFDAASFRLLKEENHLPDEKNPWPYDFLVFEGVTKGMT